MMRALVPSLVLAITAPAVASAQAQNPLGAETQRQAMQALSWMDGEWRGTATAMVGRGETKTMPHTERIGLTLGGSIRVIEGKSYNPDGTTAFNAFAVLSWDDAAGRYMMRSYANGQAVDVPLEGDATGFRWTVPSRGGELRYSTVHENGEWIETGDYVMEGRPPMRVIDMRLRRIGDTDWPAGGAVAPTD